MLCWPNVLQDCSILLLTLSPTHLNFDCALVAWPLFFYIPFVLTIMSPDLEWGGGGGWGCNPPPKAY